jgi:hypothetical protein
MRYLPVEGADFTLNRAKQNTWAERHVRDEYVKLQATKAIRKPARWRVAPDRIGASWFRKAQRIVSLSRLWLRVLRLKHRGKGEPCASAQSRMCSIALGSSSGRNCASGGRVTTAALRSRPGLYCL